MEVTAMMSRCIPQESPCLFLVEASQSVVKSKLSPMTAGTWSDFFLEKSERTGLSLLGGFHLVEPSGQLIGLRSATG